MLVTMKDLAGCFLSKVWFGAGPSYSLWAAAYGRCWTWDWE